MTLDIVTKGIPYLHMAIVTVMVFAGVPRIISYTAMLWGACAIMSIPLTEEESTWNFPPYGDTDICLAWEFAL